MKAGAAALVVVPIVLTKSFLCFLEKGPGKPSFFFFGCVCFACWQGNE